MTTPDPRSATTARRAAVVFNPAKVDVAQLRLLIAEAEAAAGFAPAGWFETAADDDGKKAAADAVATGPALVLVAGGDGTVRTVAEQLAGSGIPLAVAAEGTGNLLARALELPVGDLPGAVKTAFTGTARVIDVGHASLEHADGSATSHVYLVMAGIGLDARMAAGTNPQLKKRVGWLAYADPIGRAVIANEDFAVHYSLDGGRRHSTRAHTVIVGNCGTLTGGILLIPDARPDDGILDAVILRTRRKGAWLQIAFRLVLSRFLHRTAAGNLLRQVLRQPFALSYSRGRRIEVAFNAPQEVELDGDSFGRITAATFTVRPAALQLIG